MTDHPVSTADAMAALRRSSHDLRASVSQDQRLAAETLLDNAAAALDEGDDARARMLVERTKALGHDEHEDVEVCTMAAHMGLFNLVSDVLEEEDDLVWVDAARMVLRIAEGAGRDELLSVLQTLDQDAQLEPAEHDAVRRLTRGAEPAVSVFDGRVLDVDDVLQVLAVTTAYDDAVADLLDEA